MTMNSTVRLLVLGSVGLAGALLAVGLAVRDSGQQPAPPRLAVDPAVQASEPASAGPPLPRAPGSEAPWMATIEPPWTEAAAPSAPCSEQLTSTLAELLAQDEEPTGDAAGAGRAPAAPVREEAPAEEPIFAEPPSAAPAETVPAPGPVAPPPPQPAAPASRPAVEEVVGEGDGHLTINLQDTDIHKVLQLLGKQGGLNILSTKSVQGNVSAALQNVDVDTALAAILKSTGYVARREGKFIYVGTAQDFQSMAQAGDKISTRIYRPNYVRAAELQALFTPLLTPQIGVVGVTSPAESGIAADSSVAGGDRYAGADAVVARDYDAVLAQLDQIYAEVDRRPPQVAIEAMILSVKLDDGNQFGVDFQFLRDRQHVRFATGSPVEGLGDVSFTDGGLKFGFLDSTLGAFVSALETIGDVNVVATPRVLCVNKQRAEILIGSQKGYVNSTTTETATTQTVEFLEVGTQLRLRPFISSDGLIRMEIHPELSTGAVNLLGGFTLPEKDVTQVTTNIMVRDGCTVIIGGLMREDLTQTTSRVPLLGSTPGIGFLFRTKKETSERHELIVLVTPRIVYDEDMCPEGDRAACEFHRRQALYSDQMSPIGGRNLARNLLRKAQAAWHRGDRAEALRTIQLALHYDPLNRTAIELRSEIAGGGRRAAADHARDADGEEETWIDDAGPPVDERLHPLDAGRLGPVRTLVKPETAGDSS
jgi:type IV pilus assembly protein PilQ